MGTAGDISLVVFNDVVSVVISSANCWQERRVLMSCLLSESAGCRRELLDMLLSLWLFSFFG